jgi:hypothetical protein
MDHEAALHARDLQDPAGLVLLGAAETPGRVSSRRAAQAVTRAFGVLSDRSTVEHAVPERVRNPDESLVRRYT